MTEFKIIGYNNDRPFVIDDITCSLTGAMLMPRGISDERPPSAVQGMLRYNTEEHYFEYFSGETNSWSPISDLPSGTNGDVIISDGSGGLNSTNKLNVNPSNGTITATGALTVVGGVGIGENLNVANATTTTNLTVTDQLDASGVDISNNLNVTGTTTTNDLTVYNQLDTSGVDISNNLNVANTTTTTNLTVTDQLDASGIDISNNLNVTGATTITNLTVYNQLDASGVDISNNLNVSNTTTTNDLTVYNQLDASGVDISNNLNVANTTTTNDLIVYNQLDASGVDISNNLNVTGAITNVGTASLYNGQLTAGVGGVNKIIAGAGNNNLVVDLSNQRVGINKATPDEELDINGTLRIEANGTQTIRFYDTQGGGSPDEDGRIEVTQDGGGGEMKFYTLETGNGTPQERLSINRRGALGLSGNYGSAGQVLSSNGSGNAVSWVSPVSNIYAGASISQIIGPAVNVETTLNNWTSQVASGITGGATNVFTAQSSGWYSLGFSFNCKGTTNYNNFTKVFLRIKKNGTNYHVLNDDDRPGAGDDVNISITFGGSIFIDLNTNDIITFTIQVNSDNHTLTGYCSLEKTADAPLSVPATEFGEVATSADTQGGKMILKTKDNLNQLTDKVIINHEGKLGFRGAIYGIAGDVLTNNASGLPEWMAAGDLGDVKIRGTREWWANNTIDGLYSYTGASPYFIRAFHFHLNNTNFANPQSNNSSLAIADYYGIRFSAFGATHSTINFPTNHVYFHLGYSQSSDDRLKHNETPITDGLSVINQINVLRYDKAPSVTSTDMKREVGMIAQEVQTIPQLSHCVAEPMYEEDNYKMVYQDIHNYHIAATQELYKLVLDLQARIAVLEAK